MPIASSCPRISSASPIHPHSKGSSAPVPAPLSKTRPDSAPHYLQTPDVCCYVISVPIQPAARHVQRNLRVKHPLIPALSTCV